MSYVNILCREKQNVWVCWVGGGDVGGGCACFPLHSDHHVWMLTSCHSCRASWEKVLGSHFSNPGGLLLLLLLPLCYFQNAAINWVLLFSTLICIKLYISRKLAGVTQPLLNSTVLCSIQTYTTVFNIQTWQHIAERLWVSCFYVGEVEGPVVS